MAVFSRSRRGSSMVEAAVVFPIIVLSVLTVIYILLAMYSQTAASAKLHMALAETAAEESGTRIYGESQDKLIYAAGGNRIISEMFSEIKIDTSKKSGIINKSIVGKGRSKVKAKGLIERSAVRNFADMIYIIDEEEYIRCADTYGKIIK